MAVRGLAVPWIFFAPAGWKRLRTSTPPAATFLLLWILVPPVFFSIPTTKLPLYILLSYPAFALLAAAASAELGSLKLPLKNSGGVVSLLGAGMIAAAAIFLFFGVHAFARSKTSPRTVEFDNISTVG